MTNIKVEHEELISLLNQVYTRTKTAGLVRTTRALADAIRLIHWESAVIFDSQSISKRVIDQYASESMVLDVDDEVTAV
jgi:hypothetical protein